MPTSIERAPGWWILRACSRNPLVRALDRLELLIMALAFVAVLVAAAEGLADQLGGSKTQPETRPAVRRP
jgi:hypothetical protein